MTLNAERSVICGGAAHKVRFQEGEGEVIAVAVAVTMTVKTLADEGTIVVVSKAVATLVTKMVERGGDANEVWEGETEEKSRDRGNAIGMAMDTCERKVALALFWDESDEIHVWLEVAGAARDL